MCATVFTIIGAIIGSVAGPAGMVAGGVAGAANGIYFTSGTSETTEPEMDSKKLSLMNINCMIWLVHVVSPFP